MLCMVRVLKSGVVAGNLGEVAVAALASIDGIQAPHVEHSDNESVILSYRWTKGAENFLRTDEVLARFGLRKDWNWHRDPLGHS